jgi:hypothetical protein
MKSIYEHLVELLGGLLMGALVVLAVTKISSCDSSNVQTQTPTERALMEVTKDEARSIYMALWLKKIMTDNAFDIAIDKLDHQGLQESQQARLVAKRFADQHGLSHLY